MRYTSRTLLLGLLLLAIPFQGFAAAAMLVCGVRHAQVIAAQPAPQMQQPDAAVPEEHCEKSGAPASRFTMKCDACAACGALLAAQVAPTPCLLAVQEPALERIPFTAPLPTVYVPDGLERPPRSIPA